MLTALRRVGACPSSGVACPSFGVARGLQLLTGSLVAGSMTRRDSQPDRYVKIESSALSASSC